MRPRAFVTGLAQETNVFGPLPTGLASFSGRFEAEGVSRNEAPPFPESLAEAGERRQAQGLLDLVHGPMVGAHPSGLVTRHAYETLREGALRRLAAAGPLDIVAVHLHGAMIADGYDDCEGDLLGRIRQVVGEDCAIGVMIDPHAHLSKAMVEASDIIVAYKEYPHTDFRERAEEVWDLLLATHEGRIKPVSAVWDTGVIAVFHTSRPEVRALVETMQRLEAGGEALSVSLIHSFPWGDGPDFGSRALAICDADAIGADRIARDLADRARSVALAGASSGVATEAALDRVCAATDAGVGPFVLADSADNPGGGAAGDSTFVLEALLARDAGAACLGPLWDPQAVEIAFNAGVGARLAMRIGGKTGPCSGRPLDLEVEVTALDANATQDFAGTPFPLGRAAAVRTGNVDIILVTERDQARGPDLFTRMGVDLNAMRLVVVKSSQHFHAGFAPLAREVIYLDGPGSLQADLSVGRQRRIVRPRWPMDKPAPAPRRVLVKQHRTASLQP
ncbi:M81 family metallopeptidase [Phenylobacterium sp.]|uniref:M81 family metallopeptidase n=1 Tax=Phenylobacterium sp. TaxID=1871053 RepID=UPI0035B25E17